MTYSKLVDDVILTKKYSSRYGTKIDKFVIHHMAGKMTARRCAEYFVETPRQVSANYTIGYDGSLVCNVPEEYRAWTTGNYLIDNRAITVEVSNIEMGGNWAVSDASIKTLIKLIHDVAVRYGWKTITYDGTKNSTLQKHEWYQDTVCPGPYLGSKFGYIRDEVNKLIKSGNSSNYTPSIPKTDSVKKPTKSVSTIAQEVINGAWGNGTERKRRLEKAGYTYSVVQAKVQDILNGGSKIKKDPLMGAKYLKDENWGFVANYNIYARTAPSTKAGSTGIFAKGSYVEYDKVYVGNGYTWISYINSSNVRIYLPVRENKNGVAGPAWGNFVDPSTRNKLDGAKFIKNETGTFIPNATIYMRDIPSLSGKITGRTNSGKKYGYTKVYENDGYRWIRNTDGNYTPYRRLKGDTTVWGKFI